MKLRRVEVNQRFEVQAAVAGQWIRLRRVEGIAELARTHHVDGDLGADVLAVCQLGEDGLASLRQKLEQVEGDASEDWNVCLPFVPASFRDFMLFESHAIDAARGYVKRFMPALYPAARLVERMTGRPFKRYRPRPLWYQQPIYYFGNHLNFGVSGDEVIWPAYSQALDYELELGAVLARPLCNATAREAEAAIGGFVVLNDCSARDVQKDEMESGFGPQKAKHFFSAMSGALVTADQILPQITALTGGVSINGVRVSRCDTSRMYHTLGEAIAFASKGERLYPGELFGTGTLPGGSGMETGNWLSPGDTLELEIEQIATLTNRVAVRS